MSLIVSRFCILFSRGVTLMVIKRVTLLKRRAMGKVWFIVGLITKRYDTAIIATKLMDLCV
ncbi:hypothetical protein D5O62_05160 [Salmonella enterica subsp. enterica serovar Warnow]|nr:hypothetical protein [Salmonella enterica subsp. enterica serovar Warnow]